MGYSHSYQFILEFYNVFSIIFLLTCIHRLYQFLTPIYPWYMNILALYYSIYIVTGIYNAFSYIEGYPLLILSCSMSAHYSEDVSNSFQETFNDMAYNSITDNMGVLLFNHYLYQHLENEPMWFLRHLVVLSEDQVISTFADNPDILKDCIWEYNTQKKAAILDSCSTLNSVVNSVVERAMSELNIDLLERHNIYEWQEVYIRYLQDNPITIDGTKYIVKFDSELGIRYLVDMSGFDTFEYGYEQMVAGNARLDYWASSRGPIFKAVIGGVMKRPSLDILSMNSTLFRNAFQAEKRKLEFEEEANRLNAIDLDIFH